MAISRGKEFEAHFKSDWATSFPDGVIIRLPDQMNGYKSTSQNICDFIAFTEGHLYFLECKSHHGNTLPFSEIPQYERMLPYVGKPGVRAGVIVWFEDHEATVAYVPIRTITQMKKEGKKSIHINDINSFLYDIVSLPSTQTRVYCKSDCTPLLKLEEGQ